MKNKEFYKDEIFEVACKRDRFALNKTTKEIDCCLEMNCCDCLFDSSHYCCGSLAMKWLEEEHVEPLLTGKEKRYLENVLRPFRDRVERITKMKFLDDYEFLNFYVKSLGGFGTDSFDLPVFKLNTAYLGMEQDKWYTPEELGLFADEEENNEE